MSVPNFKRIGMLVQKLIRGPKISKLGHVTQVTPTYGHLWSTYRRGMSSISEPNLKQIALFVRKLLVGTQNFEICSRNAGHAHLWVFYGPHAGGVRPLCPYRI